MGEITWQFTQDHSDDILSSGLHKLQTSPTNSAPYAGYSCNYLITQDKIPYYIGEAQQGGKRIAQQFNPKTSTFYKTFQKLGKSAPITAFDIQLIATQIGRKEIEEFGIVNLKTSLNKFQLDKRVKCKATNDGALWDRVQTAHAALLEEAVNIALGLPFLPWISIALQATAGIYLVRNIHGELIYIGESSDLRKRHASHSAATYFSALRRHIGTKILSYELQERNGKKKYFTDTEDEKVTGFLKSCHAAFHPVSFGRYELEEYLIRKYHPHLNRKGNKV